MKDYSKDPGNFIDRKRLGKNKRVLEDLKKPSGLCLWPGKEPQPYRRLWSSKLASYLIYHTAYENSDCYINHYSGYYK